MVSHSSTFSQGLIAGGMVDGTINIWDPSKLQASGDEEGLIASVEQQHQGAIPGLHFNPHAESSYLLASGGSDGEVFVMSLENPDEPTVFVPAPPPSTTKHTADITRVAWNSQVVYILASASQNGSCIIWDLRQKRAWCELRDPSGGAVSDIAWNPDQGLHLITASGDDKNPVLKLWDLRSSTSLPLATLPGHTEGILSVSWCPSDTSLLLSCGKDNRTILWDLFNLQPVYELPFKQQDNASSRIGEVGGGSNSNGVFGSLASSASHRRFDIEWSPCLPAVASASSFDRKVQFFSLTGARSKLGRAPKWLRKPVGACFGFGGKLVTIENIQLSAPAANSKKPPQFGRLKVYQVAENPELTVSSDYFHDCYTNGKFREYCEVKSSRDDGHGQSSQVWSLMKVICFGGNPREELLTFLGFDSNRISITAQNYLAARASGTAATVSAVSVPEVNTPLAAMTFDTNVNAADVFGSVPASPERAPAPPPTLAKPSPAPTAAQSLKLEELLEGIRAGEEAESSILQAIIVGNFELAVDCCISAGLWAEALLLCQCGGAELRARTQAAFFEQQRAKHPFLNVLHAVLKNQLMDFVVNSDLKSWKETMAMLSTYGKSEEFPSLCETLAARLENELNDRASAALCYMCAANVIRTVQFWTEELDEANYRNSKIDTLALQDYVEKILVFTQANPVDKLPVECGRHFASYAELLANQGRLTQAMTYLKGDSTPVAILVDRLYHAGDKPAGSRAPTFPFQKMQVEAAVAQPAAVVATASGVRGGVVKNAADNFGGSASSAASSSSAFGRGNPAAASAHQIQQSSASFASSQYGGSGAAAAVSAPVPLPAAPVAPGLPPGWLQLLDPTSNRYYYVNEATGASQWEPPAMPLAAPVPVAAPVATYPHADPMAANYGGNTAATMPSPGASRPRVEMDSAFPNALAAAPVTNAAPAPVAATSSGRFSPTPDADCVVALGQMIEAIAGIY